VCSVDMMISELYLQGVTIVPPTQAHRLCNEGMEAHVTCSLSLKKDTILKVQLN